MILIFILSKIDDTTRQNSSAQKLKKTTTTTNKISLIIGKKVHSPSLLSLKWYHWWKKNSFSKSKRINLSEFNDTKELCESLDSNRIEFLRVWRTPRQTFDASVLYLRAFRWGASSWLASAQTILVENRPAERDDSRAVSHYVPRLRNCNRHCSTRCQSPFDTSIATGLLFIALQRKTIFRGLEFFRRNLEQRLSREDSLSSFYQCFSSIFEITGWF